MRGALVLLTLIGAFAKSTSGTISIGGRKDEHRWKYLSKFGYLIGEGHYRVRFRTIRPYIDSDKPVRLSVFLDEEWDEVEAMEDLCSRATKSRVTASQTLKPHGEWSNWFESSLTQSVRPHVWYFVLDDCEAPLTQITRIRYEVEATQPNGSEFSVELQGMLPVMCIKVALGLAFLVYYMKQCQKYVASAESLHPVIWTLSSGILLHFMSLFLSLLHLWMYSGNGYGIRAVDIISEMVATVSHVLITSLLILLALGYTLLQSNLGELDIVIPIVFIICIVHVLLVGFAKIKDDASYKFHENEGVIGWIICLVRVALYSWFWWAINSTCNECRTNVKLLFFLRKFKIAASLYFLSFPLIFVVAGLWAPYYRHCVFSLGSFAMQAVSILWLTKLFLSRGDYFEVSTLNVSFLPGGNRQGISKTD